MMSLQNNLLLHMNHDPKQDLVPRKTSAKLQALQQ